MHLTEGGAIVLEVVRVTTRSRIAHVRKSLSTPRLSNFVGTAEVSTKLPWKSLSKRVETDGVSQSHKRTS